MTPLQLTRAIADIVEAADAQLGELAKRYQRYIFARVEELLRSDDPRYQIDISNGQIKPTAKNLKALNRVIGQVQQMLVPDFLSAKAEEIGASFADIETANNEYFRSSFDKFNPSASYEEIKNMAAARTISTLTNSGTQEAIMRPIEQILQSGTTGGQSRNSILETLRATILDDEENLGSYASYTSRIVRDSLNVYSRTYAEAVTGFIPEEDRWYLYQGGTVKATRPFCNERAGNYYHLREIKTWAGRDWQGKHKNTTRGNILLLLGGYNCMHQAVLVSALRVPEKAKTRAKELGFIE